MNCVTPLFVICSVWFELNLLLRHCILKATKQEHMLSLTPDFAQRGMKSKKCALLSCQFRSRMIFFFQFLSLWLFARFFLCVSHRHQRSWKMTPTLNRRTMILAAGLVSRLKMTSLLLDRVLGWVDVHFPTVLKLLGCAPVMVPDMEKKRYRKRQYAFGLGNGWANSSYNSVWCYCVSRRLRWSWTASHLNTHPCSLAMLESIHPTSSTYIAWKSI